MYEELLCNNECDRDCAAFLRHFQLTFLLQIEVAVRISASRSLVNWNESGKNFIEEESFNDFVCAMLKRALGTKVQCSTSTGELASSEQSTSFPLCFIKALWG